ncbi:MAG: polyphosphate kinase 1 [Lachnospiraceae bacterium]
MKHDGIQCYENRELSWLKFNERVLEEAEDNANPLCERLNFLSIFQSNLDEFFMVRVGSLHDQMLLAESQRDSKTNMTAGEQIAAILPVVSRLIERKADIYKHLMKKINELGVRLVDFRTLSDEDSVILEKYFDMEIRPLMSTIIVSKKQPFPFLKNKEIYAMAVLEEKGDKKKDKINFAIVSCNTDSFQRLIEVPSKGGSYLLAEDLILHFLPKLCPGYKIVTKSLIRITRNADIDADQIYDEDLNYRDHMAEVIKQRRKLCPVRLEYTKDLDRKVIKKLCDYLMLDPVQSFHNRTPLDLSFVYALQDTLRNHAELFYGKRAPQKSIMLDEKRSILEQVAEKDVLLSYPYESIRPFLNLLHEAAIDPEVVSIKMTLYRLAKHSKVVEALVEAAENGKQVDVLVELKARFDEENNISWSRLLEEAGCHVIYGLDGLKVHSKLCLITRKCEGRIEYITQIGTGNYNEKTARLYTDLCLMTANPDIGLEAVDVFHALSLGETVQECNHLMVAPNCLQNKILDKIQREILHAQAGEPAYIGIKINSLTDKKIMDKLIEASQAGVQIEMVIRGINCLRTKIPNLTDNIRVISIVGRFLEHARIYIFGTGDSQEIYIASADFMTRNTERRVEVAAPIYDAELKSRVYEMFQTMMHDNIKAREQMEDGTYKKVSAILKEQGDLPAPLNSQELFYAKAYQEC